MVNIYINTKMQVEKLATVGLVSILEDYAEQLEKTVTEYRSLIKTLKDKNIVVLNVDGHTDAGHFTVDKIDAERLKESGCVTDFSEIVDVDKTFYIDSSLDEFISNTDKQLDAFSKKTKEDLDKFLKEVEPFSDEALSESEETKLFEYANDDSVEDFEKEILDDLAEELIEFDLKEIAKNSNSDAGILDMEVVKLDENRFSFNLIISDLSADPVYVRFNRDKGIFEYKCGDCDRLHYESLHATYKSLRTANALISHLIEISGIKNKELAIALEFIDHDLRLLQTLLKFDYALPDDDSQVFSSDEPYEDIDGLDMESLG